MMSTPQSSDRACQMRLLKNAESEMVVSVSFARPSLRPFRLIVRSIGRGVVAVHSQDAEDLGSVDPALTPQSLEGRHEPFRARVRVGPEEDQVDVGRRCQPHRALVSSVGRVPVPAAGAGDRSLPAAAAAAGEAVHLRSAAEADAVPAAAAGEEAVAFHLLEYRIRAFRVVRVYACVSSRLREEEWTEGPGPCVAASEKTERAGGGRRKGGAIVPSRQPSSQPFRGPMYDTRCNSLPYCCGTLCRLASEML